MRDGTEEEKRSIETIHTAPDKGITLIDTAPVYGLASRKKLWGRRAVRGIRETQGNLSLNQGNTGLDRGAAAFDAMGREIGSCRR